MNYESFDLVQTSTFKRWLDGLRDRQSRSLVTARLLRLTTGAFGDVSSVGEGVNELRIHSGPGYRIYFCRRGSSVILLLTGGDKSSQARDIATAKRLAADLRGGDV